MDREKQNRGTDEKSIEFVDKILDNVHGFIPYTKQEGEIIKNPLFKRLQSIKQLSLVNWVFPGSEHTRFIHSLGVMHVADKIAQQLKLSDNSRKIIRFAGLLHDIGHYPLSHLCESVYIDEDVEIDTDIVEYTNKKTKKNIDEFKIISEKKHMDPMKVSEGLHHESVGGLIISNSDTIKDIIVKECGPKAVESIVNIIKGNPKFDDACEDYDVLVQILHSEFDADGIDYMLRDAVFSGTSFGSFEVEHLIKSMVIEKVDNTNIVCIQPKGIAAADQYLINKFFSYSQVIFNKHSVALEWMAKQVVTWMKNTATYFPTDSGFSDYWKNLEQEKDYKKDFLNYTDAHFWNSIHNTLNNDACKNFPEYILPLCKKIIHHEELEYVAGSEIKIISKDENEIITKLKNSEFYNLDNNPENTITLLNKRVITKHIPFAEFEKLFETPSAVKANEEQEINDQYFRDKKIHRLMEGICVYDEVTNTVQLLCDDDRSLMREMCKMTLVVMRSYKFNYKNEETNNGSIEGSV